MKVLVKKLTDISLLHAACSSTLHKDSSKVSLKTMYELEHSPVRTQLFWVEIRDLPTFVSVHLVRHKVGVEHFVESNRDDRGGDSTVDRETPVKHSMLINAQALLNMSRVRLCNKAHKETVRAARAIRKGIEQVDTDLASLMVPTCIYRNGHCPNNPTCSSGVDGMMRSYNHEWDGWDKKWLLKATTTT